MRSIIIPHSKIRGGSDTAAGARAAVVKVRRLAPDHPCVIAPSRPTHERGEGGLTSLFPRQHLKSVGRALQRCGRLEVRSRHLGEKVACDHSLFPSYDLAHLRLSVPSRPAICAAANPTRQQ